MKKIFTLVFCLTTLFAIAQSPIGKGGKQLNFGVSGNSYYVPAYVSFEFGVHPDITLGPQAGMDLSFDYLNLAFRGDYHFNTLIGISQEWDFYAGTTAGFSILIGTENVTVKNGLYIGLQVGGRWYWSDRWGLNLEFGGSNLFGNARIGLSLKM